MPLMPPGPPPPASRLQAAPPAGPPAPPTTPVDGEALALADLTPITDADAETDLLIRPLSDTDYRDLAKQIARTHGIPGELFSRLVARESNWNPAATSIKGAKGLTQLMPATAQEVGVTNPDDPFEQLVGGAKYLRSLLDRYQGDTRKALAAYNAGMGNVEKYQGVPPFPETRDYVGAILGLDPSGMPTPASLPLKVTLKRGLQYTPPPVPSPEGLVQAPPAMPGAPGSVQAAAVSSLGSALGDVLPASGAMVGGAKGLQAGLKVPGPPALKALGAAVGAVGGAFLGGGAGEAARMGGEALVGTRPSAGEAVARVQEAGEAGAVGEVTGAALGKMGAGVVRLLGKGLQKGLSPEAKAAIAEYRQTYTGMLGGKRSAPLATPGQVSDNQLIDWLEGLARGAPFRSRAFDTLEREQADAISDSLDSLVREYGIPRSAEAVGKFVKIARATALKEARQQVAPLYTQLDEMTEGVGVDLTDLAQTFDKIPQAKRTFLNHLRAYAPDRIDAPEGMQEMEALADAIEEGGGDRLQKVFQGIPAPRVRALVKFLGRQITTLKRSPGVGDAEIYPLQSIKGTLQDQLGAAYRRAGVEDLYATAQNATKAYQRRFNTQFLREKLKEEASSTKFVQALTGKGGTSTGGFAPEEIRAVRRAVSPKVWQAVQARTLADVFEGQLGKKATAKQIRLRLEDHLGPDRLLEIFPKPAERRAVTAAVKKIEALQGGSRPRGGSGKMWIQFATAGAIGGGATALGQLAMGNPTGAAGTTLASAGVILLTPKLLGRLLASKAGRRMIIEGMGLPNGIPGVTTDRVLRFPAHLTTQWLREETQGYAESTRGEGDGGPPSAEDLADDRSLIEALEADPSAPPPPPPPLRR